MSDNPTIEEAPEVEGTEEPTIEVEEPQVEEETVEEPEVDQGEITEGLQRRLLTALVAADGRLHDPTDFPFDPEFLDDEAGLEKAITDLIETKPHLKKRRVGGDIGAGNRGDAAPEAPNLINIIRSMG